MPYSHKSRQHRLETRLYTSIEVPCFLYSHERTSGGSPMAVKMRGRKPSRTLNGMPCRPRNSLATTQPLRYAHEPYDRRSQVLTCHTRQR